VSRGRLTTLWMAALGSVASAIGVLHAREATAALPGSADRPAYLPADEAADRLFLSFDAVAADVYWLRAIQHYGTERRSDRAGDRFGQLEPLLSLTTTLDPHFNIAYRFGAIFLALDPPLGPGRPDRAIALLEKGLAANPARWQYAHDVAFVHYWHTGRFDEAARWFERAAAMPGAPGWLRPVAATTRVAGGDRAGARMMFSELVTSADRHVRQAAERALAQLRALDEIDRLTMIIERFRGSTGREPQGWQDLVAAGLLQAQPVDPAGLPYQYAPRARVVTLGTDSPLWPLPPAFRRR